MLAFLLMGKLNAKGTIEMEYKGIVRKWIEDLTETPQNGWSPLM